MKKYMEFSYLKRPVSSECHDLVKMSCCASGFPSFRQLVSLTLLVFSNILLNILVYPRPKQRAVCSQLARCHALMSSIYIFLSVSVLSVSGMKFCSPLITSMFSVAACPGMTRTFACGQNDRIAASAGQTPGITCRGCQGISSVGVCSCNALNFSVKISTGGLFCPP